VITGPQVTEFMDNRLLQYRLRGKNQVPIEVHDSIPAATTPDVFLILDLHAPGPQVVRLAVTPHERCRVLTKPLAEPKSQRILDQVVADCFGHRSGVPDHEAIAERDLDQRAVGRLHPQPREAAPGKGLSLR
jgi:hypothetical protein